MFCILDGTVLKYKYYEIYMLVKTKREINFRINFVIVGKCLAACTGNFERILNITSIQNILK